MTQLNLFDDGSQPVVCHKSETSYRQMFGLDNPPAGTRLKLKYMDGIDWYLLWEDCPDDENIVQGWFKSKGKAQLYAKENGWPLS